MARAPDIVEMSFVFRDEPGRVLAALLGVGAGAPHVFELPEAAEHAALATRPPRTPVGYSAPNLTTRISTKVRATATWDTRADTLRLEGYFADRATGLPRAPGPRFAIASPSFVMPPPGWEPLFRRLSAARAPLDATFATVSLHHDNGKSIVVIAFDPPR
ncbi:MAG TPA: hypothetical protein VMZ53_21580 [Kofleriaceae bacterium]|nr:hypothetical protein [Kofleriaceae bacterium]